MKKLFVLSVILLVVASPAFCSWTNIIDSNDISEVMVLTGDATFDGSLWDYTYDLANSGNNHDILRAFTLTFDNAAMVNEFSDYLASPASWQRDVFQKKVIWTWIPQYDLSGNITNLADRLNPGETFRFGFSSPRYPGSSALAACQNDFAFDGPTQGPAIPEATTIMLGFMGLGSVAGLRRIARK